MTDPYDGWERKLLQEEEEAEEAGGAGGGEEEEMPRVKAICSNCGQTILFLFEHGVPDHEAVLDLQPGEHFENKCLLCEEWAAFQIPEEPSAEETITV